jgi:broad specificity phosphatase PhoE
MKKVFIVRHAETFMNVKGVFSGRTETDLTNIGKQQATSTGKKLKQEVPKIDLIICSPYRRTYDTARLIAKEISYPEDKIIKNDLLVERGYGELEGKFGREFWEQRTFKELDNVPNAETVAEMAKRADKVLAMIRGIKQDNILVVTHGSIGRALIRVVKKIPHEHEYDEKHRLEFRIANAEIVELI